MNVEEQNEYMLALDRSSISIAWLTGIKRQFIDAGWSEPVAELMVLEILRKTP